MGKSKKNSKFCYTKFGHSILSAICNVEHDKCNCYIARFDQSKLFSWLSSIIILLITIS